MREAEPPKRTSILEASQKSTEVSQPQKDTSQNHVSELPAASATATPTTEQQVGEETPQTGGSKEEGEHRLSNGLEPHTMPTDHSPPSSTLQDCRLSTLSTESNSSLSNGVVFPTEQELSSAGEESSMGTVEDSETRHRHESAKSVTEETRELDEFLNRSSVTSVLAESQLSRIETSLHAKEFERVGGSSEEDLERGGEEAGLLEDSTVRILAPHWGCAW